MSIQTPPGLLGSPIYLLSAEQLMSGAQKQAPFAVDDTPKSNEQAAATPRVQQISSPLSSETISAVYEASQIGSMDTGIHNDEPAVPTAGETAKEKFLAYMQMRPEELFFTLKLEAKLKEMGMTMEQFEALPPEEQQAIIAEVKAEIREEARKRAENKIEEARLAHSAQQAAKDLSPDKSESAEDEEKNISELEKLAMRLAENNKALEEGRGPLSMTNLTRSEIEKASNELFRNGEITLEELYNTHRPDGKLKREKAISG